MNMNSNSYLVLFVLTLCISSFVQALSICDASSLLYRSYDGTCNNVLYKNWGAAQNFYRNGPEGREAYPWQHPPRAHITYAEIDQLPPDGPRGNARNISITLGSRPNDDEIDEINHSMFAIMFGQFINHDLENNQLVDPHISEFNLATYVVDRNDPTCQPNNVPPNIHPYRCNDEDKVISADARFSKRALQSDGTYRVYNNATSYIDLDLVYGRSKEWNGMIRSHTHGKILMQEEVTFALFGRNHTLTNLLPHWGMTGLPVNIRDIRDGVIEETFTAGDERVNENIALIFFQTLFAREHNRVCDELIENNLLWKLFPTLFDELIFQKARSIVIAKYQHVVYGEYFRNAFGEYFHDLLGSYQGYNPLVDPGTNLAFSGAAFRYGHFAIRNYFTLDECGVNYYMGAPAENPDEKMVFLGMTNPTPPFLSPLGIIVTAGGFENAVRGLINERSSPNDLKMHADIQSLSLVNARVLDLLSLDIIRQRYNNLPNYQRIRKHYHGLDSVTNNIYGLSGCPASLENDANTDDPYECFFHITQDAEKAEKLQSLYRKVNLIDAVVGVTYEAHIPGTSFSRTSGNLIVDQFRRSRDGDRFFYKLTLNSGMFTQSERQEILGTTMKELIERNFDMTVPENPWKSPENYRQSLIDSCQ